MAIGLNAERQCLKVLAEHTFALVLLNCKTSGELILLGDFSISPSALLACPEPESCTASCSAMPACTPVACVLMGKLLFSALSFMLSAGLGSCVLGALFFFSCLTDLLASAETYEEVAGSSPFP